MSNQAPSKLSAIPGALSQEENPAPVVLDYVQTARPRWAQRIVAFTIWPYYFLLAAACLWLVWIGRYPYSFTARFMCVVLLGFFAVTWCAWLLLRQILLQKYPVPPLPDILRFLPLQIIATVSVLLAVLLHLEIPSRIAFRLSEPAMRRAAESLLIKGKPSGFPPSFWWPQHVGLFDFDAVTCLSTSHSVFFYLRDGGLFTNAGWTYSPEGPPDPPSGEGGPGTQTSYNGPWYRTTLQW